MKSQVPLARLGLTFCITLSVLCSGCAGALFGGSHPEQSKDLEEIGTRRANSGEEKRLDSCLHYIFKRQQAEYAKTRNYVREIKRLDPDEHCKKIQLSMETAPSGFTATAKIKDSDSIVKWTVNETGEVVEHDDMSFDFSL